MDPISSLLSSAVSKGAPWNRVWEGRSMGWTVQKPSVQVATAEVGASPMGEVGLAHGRVSWLLKGLRTLKQQQKRGTKA